MTPAVTINPKEFYKQVLSRLQLVVTPMVYGSLFLQTSLEEYDAKEISILCKDDFIKKSIEKKFSQIIEQAAAEVAGHPIKVNFLIKKAHITVKDTQSPNASDNKLGPLFETQGDPHKNLAEKALRAGLVPKFTFENYITGKSNTLAFAVANAVASRPGEVYNPMFIYSGVGLGKTHLVQAIGNKILQDKPGAKVIYTTGENFMNELITTIQSGRAKGKYISNDFRNKYRKADVLIVDDIQVIAKTDSTQEEFFHTFNDLYMSQRQIIITSDRPPKDFTGIEDRITSRFSSGILLDIQPPDYETRVAILRKKRDLTKDKMSNEIIDYIADTVTSNIRELEGAYIQVLAQTNAAHADTAITLEQAAAALGKTIKEKSRKNVNMNMIVNAVCNYYSIKTSEIKGKRRNKELVVPRQVAMYLIKELTNTPFMSIGEFLGGRDHTTIMHGVDKIQTEIGSQAKMRQDVVNVKNIVFGG